MTIVLWGVALVVLVNVGVLLWAFWVDRCESIRERQMARGVTMGPDAEIIGGFGNVIYPDRELEVPPDEWPGARE